jgi:hypothetical protein
MTQANKQLGIVRRFNVERCYGFVRNAETDYQGNVVPIGHGRQNDHFFGIAHLRRAGIAPEAIVEGMIVRFNVQPSQRHEGKTEAVDIELVAATDAEAA